MTSRCGYVALIGAPNAGKSTLVNQMVGQKIAIVTPKVQTTRQRALGIISEEEAQLILVDTPGIFAPRPSETLEKAIVQEAWAGVEAADVLCLLIDARRGIDEGNRLIIEALKARKLQAVVLLNKIDTVEKEVLLGLASAVYESGVARDIFMVSALKGSGVADVVRHLASLVPEGSWLYPEDVPTTMTERQIAAEITRETLFLRLHQELPYALFVETESWEEKADGSAVIRQMVVVGREAHKKILLGEKGQTLKQVGAAARREMARVLDRPVHLFLFVRVEEKWKNDREAFRRMGLEFPG